MHMPKERTIKLTTMSFPAFSDLFATLIAAAAAAPDDIPTCISNDTSKEISMTLNSKILG